MIINSSGGTTYAVSSIFIKVILNMKLSVSSTKSSFVGAISKQRMSDSDEFGGNSRPTLLRSSKSPKYKKVMNI